MPSSLFPGCLQPQKGRDAGDYPGIFGSISVSPYLPPQWAPGPENSYLAGQHPLKWPFLAAPTIQGGWEDTKEVRDTQAGALDRQFGGREDRCMNDSNCASLHKP